MTERPIKVIKKADQRKPQSDPEYKIQRHAAGLIKAFAQKFPEDFDRLVREIQPKAA